jgi:hypothetical protein
MKAIWITHWLTYLCWISHTVWAIIQFLRRTKLQRWEWESKSKKLCGVGRSTAMNATVWDTNSKRKTNKFQKYFNGRCSNLRISLNAISKTMFCWSSLRSPSTQHFSRLTKTVFASFNQNSLTKSSKYTSKLSQKRLHMLKASLIYPKLTSNWPKLCNRKSLAS